MWNLQDAKNKFSAVVNAALAEGPQHVTRRGQPAVVVVAADEWARLNRVAPPDRSLMEALCAMPAAPDEQAEQDFETALKRMPMTTREIDWGE
jgi:prevent-host-death family protein